jgi:hypothetical protein
LDFLSRVLSLALQKICHSNANVGERIEGGGGARRGKRTAQNSKTNKPRKGV